MNLAHLPDYFFIIYDLKYTKIDTKMSLIKCDYKTQTGKYGAAYQNQGQHREDVEDRVTEERPPGQNDGL